MLVTKHHDDVYTIDNFLSSEEREELMNIISNIPKDFFAWTLLSDTEELHHFWAGKIYRIGDIEILQNILSRVYDSFYLCASTTINGIIDIQRTLPTDSPMDVHTDKEGYGRIKYGVVIYINDDYDGGEIDYPALGITIKPTAGMAAIHDGDAEHGVLPVSKGPRYILTTFVQCDHVDEACSLVLKS